LRSRGSGAMLFLFREWEAPMSGAGGQPTAFFPLRADERAASRSEEERFLRELSATLERQHERSVAYANLVLAVGYAGYFGLWSLAKEFVAPGWARASLFAMAVSLALFVLFEIAKMAAITRLTFRHADEMQNPDTSYAEAAERLKRLREAQEDEERRLRGYWFTLFWLTVVSGLAGALILMVALLRGA